MTKDGSGLLRRLSLLALAGAFALHLIWLASGYVQFHSSCLRLAEGDLTIHWDIDENRWDPDWRFEWFEYTWNWLPRYQHIDLTIPRSDVYTIPKDGKRFPPAPPPPWRINSYTFIIPILPPALALLGAAVALLVLKVRRQRNDAGCVRCGYDLTGNTSGVCSECGKPINPELLES